MNLIADGPADDINDSMVRQGRVPGGTGAGGAEAAEGDQGELVLFEFHGQGVFGEGREEAEICLTGHGSLLLTGMIFV